MCMDQPTNGYRQRTVVRLAENKKCEPGPYDGLKPLLLSPSGLHGQNRFSDSLERSIERNERLKLDRVLPLYLGNEPLDEKPLYEKPLEQDEMEMVPYEEIDDETVSETLFNMFQHIIRLPNHKLKLELIDFHACIKKLVRLQRMAANDIEFYSGTTRSHRFVCRILAFAKREYAAAYRDMIERHADFDKVIRGKDFALWRQYARYPVEPEIAVGYELQE